ncbi:MAG: phosphomannomutase/phosphoglucomutase [Candidatus Gastranaerophilaceae bacterium]|jgi:phosphomannomutase/phosphoglucomutase
MFEFNGKAFGKNDIRGIYGETVTPDLFYFTGKAYAKYVSQRSGKELKDIWLTVSQDARLHSPELASALIKGINSVGANVVDLGLVPTPLGYFSEVAKIDLDISLKNFEISGAMIVTASHNPPEYNGLKMTYNKASLSEKEIREVKIITEEECLTKTKIRYKTGITKSYDIVPVYQETQLRSFANIGKGIKLVVDSANATGGVVAPQLYRDLGCEVIDIFTEPDGNFPNHHPNPSDEKTLDAIKAKVQETGADFGIAFDGDADRVGIVDDTGYNLPGDQLLLIFALDILAQFKGRKEKPKFISEVKCSQHLFDMINANGGDAIMWKTGHGYIKSKMKEENAIFAGEMSGHIFFRDKYYGFDDAVYAGCRFIETVAKHKKNNPDFKVSEFIKSLPKVCTSKEVRYSCPNELKETVLQDLTETFAENPDIFGSKIASTITIDGIRLVFEGGFALIRQSNTEPVFTLRFEASDEESLENYKNTMLKTLDISMDKFVKQKNPV